MSTRRARIKAVASLPTRRKNVDVRESKGRQAILSENSSNTIHISDSNVKPESINNILNNEQSNTESTNELQAKVQSPNLDKVPIITPTSLYKNTLTLAHRKNSPLRTNTTNNVITTSGGKSPKTILLNSPINNDGRSNSKQSGNFNHNTPITKSSNEMDGVSGIHEFLAAPEAEPVVDGIVPLQQINNMPKPIDLLKSEMISENAEILFDPIIPLPSPGKVRPKLRPAPRLAPLRRNSIQGSASESEDETRRALLNSSVITPAPQRQRHDSHTSTSTVHLMPNREINRVRTDSVCSGFSQSTQPPMVASPTKEKQFMSKSRRLESSRRMSALRRKQRARDGVSRDALTMYDLIFYNPTTNPIVPDKDDNIGTTAKVEKEEKIEKHDDSSKAAPQVKNESDEKPAPVPQIKLGPNGEIILDEQSLVIEQTEGPRKLSNTVVHENSFTGLGRGRYTRAARSADWTDSETVRFYRALAAIGTDFSMMAPLFPDRTRRELKIKFKKEERINSAQVERTLRAQVHWDARELEIEFAEGRKADREMARKEREEERELRRQQRTKIAMSRRKGYKMGKAARALDIYPPEGRRPGTSTTVENFIKRAKGPKPPQTYSREPSMATIVPTGSQTAHSKTKTTLEMATLTKISTPKDTPPPVIKTSNPQSINPMNSMPSNIETGSLVVLTVNDPKMPSQKMLQTYISDGVGSLTPISLPPSFLNSVVGYMKRGTPKSIASPQPSPSNVQDKSIPNVMQLPTPTKRQRYDSYTITQI